MKTQMKITFFLLLASFMSHAQLSHNMVVLKPVAITPLVATLTNTSNKVLWSHNNVLSGATTPWGTENFSNCQAGGYTYTFNYTDGNGASYLAKTWGLNGGGSISVPGGKLNVGSGSIVFNISGNMNPQTTIGIHSFGTNINFLGATIQIIQQGFAYQSNPGHANCP